jgi:hypothetical protein
MSDLPFVITQEAEIKIESALLDAQKDLKLLGMERVLVYATSCSWSNPEGVGGGYPFAHLVLGWHRSEEVIGNSDYTELELVGFRVYAHQSTLERLRSKRIVLDQGKGMAGGDMLPVQDLAGS